jgi:hypothetical protein
MENYSVDVADNKIDKDLLHEITSILYEYDFGRIKTRIIIFYK